MAISLEDMQEREEKLGTFLFRQEVRLQEAEMHISILQRELKLFMEEKSD